MSTALEKDLGVAEFARTVFAFTPSENVEYEALLDPAFWANVGHKVKPGCQIEALAPDMSWYALFVVISCARTWVKLAPISGKVNLTATKKQIKALDLDQDEKGYTIAFKGQSKKFAITRKSDLKEIKDGLPTEEEATLFLRNHLKALTL
jgi:hypothetical protein